MSAPLSPTAWRAAGEWISFENQRLFVARHGAGPAVLALHAFPTASYDFHKIVERLREQYAWVLFDYPGFGFSDKPRDGRYSLCAYADAAEAVCAHFGLDRVHLLAHDIGASVALELLRRGRLAIEHLTLMNGSVWSIPFRDPRWLVPQWLSLHPRLGPLIGRWRLFRRAALQRFFKPLFVRPLSAAEVDAFWVLVAYNDGTANYHQLMRYMPERWQHQTTWLAALAQHHAPLNVIWGLADPVATPAVAERIVQHRPDAQVTRLANVGHYPHWEAPDTVAGTLAAAWRAAGSSTSVT